MIKAMLYHGDPNAVATARQIVHESEEHRMEGGVIPDPWLQHIVRLELTIKTLCDFIEEV